MAHPDPEHLTTIFNTYLETNAPGLSVGDGEAPESPSPAYPYLVVTPLSPEVTGSLGNGSENHSVEWQVTSVGLDRKEAQGGIAACRDLLLGATEPDFTAASYKKTGEVKIVPAPALTSDQGDKPPLFLANETYRMMVVPV